MKVWYHNFLTVIYWREGYWKLTFSLGNLPSLSLYPLRLFDNVSDLAYPKHLPHLPKPVTPTSSQNSSEFLCIPQSSIIGHIQWIQLYNICNFFSIFVSYNINSKLCPQAFCLHIKHYSSEALCFNYLCYSLMLYL